MTTEQLLNTLEEIRLSRNESIEEFYPSIGLSKSTIHVWKRGAVPKSIELTVNIINLLKGEH